MYCIRFGQGKFVYFECKPILVEWLTLDDYIYILRDDAYDVLMSWWKG